MLKYKTQIGYTYLLEEKSIKHIEDIEDNTWYRLTSYDGHTIGQGKEIKSMAQFYGYDNYNLHIIIQSNDPELKLPNNII